jgi:site-specific DNA-methyltransferase (adenine-specific)
MILNMDAIEGLKKIPDNSVDVVLVDPPYNIGKDFGNSKYKMEMQEYVSWCKQWMDESTRILKDTGTLYVYGFSEILAHLSVNMEIPHRWLIWHYTNKTVPSSRFWQRSHESIIVGWKSDKSRTFNRDDVREPYTEAFKKGYSAKDGKPPRTRPATKGRFQHQKYLSYRENLHDCRFLGPHIESVKPFPQKETIYQVNEKGALPRDVIKVPALAGGAGVKERYFHCEDCGVTCSPSEKKKHKGHNITKHPTQKPLELTKRLLMAAKPLEGGIVVVPFVGSGSELAVAKSLGMTGMGFEINETYIKIANKMIKDVKE